MLGKSRAGGGTGSDSGYCENLLNEGKHSRSSSSDYLINPQSSMGVELNNRLELGDGDIPTSLKCRRLSTDLITPQMSVSDKCDSSSSSSSSRMTGSSCQALRHAVAALNRLDDFTCEKIGSGFFSEVFKVTHRTTGQVMVLKMNLLRSNRPNMLKEVQLMNQLSHPNILGFMGVCVHEGQLHALTEYINGGSLEQLNLNRGVELPHRTRMKLAVDIAQGMEYLHSRGVFHRDLTSKNVLIKTNDETDEMMAVVGDFGLAAKIPDPKSGYRLPTVGSPYWMSPECLKGQWYDEKSDVFSYGIVLCELIARCEADPDILPRTENFGLDYLAFADMCGPCPPEFLKLAFLCCNFEPKSRPSFTEIVKRLSTITGDYDAAVQLRSATTSGGATAPLPPLNAVDLPPHQTAGKMAAGVVASAGGGPAGKGAGGLGAKSEEVLPGAAVEAKESVLHKKLIHRRSLSEDVGSIVFPPHTAPSDKARCHFLLPRVQSQPSVVVNAATAAGHAAQPLVTAKHVGESMLEQDPHYKPTSNGDKANPFAALSQFRGVKKILGGSPNKGLGPGSFVQGVCGDLFSSCFELPSPFYGPPGDGELRRVDSFADDLIVGRNEERDWLENLAWKHPKLKRTRSVNKENEAECRVNGAESALVELESSPSAVAKDKTVVVVASVNSNNNSRVTSKPRSLPGSPTSIRRRSFSPPAIATSSPQSDVESKRDDLDDLSSWRKNMDDKLKSTLDSSLFAHPLFRCGENGFRNEPGIFSNLVAGQRSCSSNSNLADAALFADDQTFVLKRRGSCESGFFSSIGEDYGNPAGDLLLSQDFAAMQNSRTRVHNTSSATLSSSSAASSLFLLDDSGTTVSSIRSGSGELGDLDDVATQGPIGICRPHHSLLFAAKRSSSIYTDSSEDISSLGGGDLYWEELSRGSLASQPQQISKIVEYFERKQSSSRSDLLDDVWDVSGVPTPRHQREMLYHSFGNRNSSPIEFARRMEGASLNEAMRSNKIALLRKSLERVALSPAAAPQQQAQTLASQEKTTGCVKRNVNATQRLMICEGAVKSKLPLFDRNRTVLAAFNDGIDKISFYTR